MMAARVREALLGVRGGVPEVAAVGAVVAVLVAAAMAAAVAALEVVVSRVAAARVAAAEGAVVVEVGVQRAP